MTAGILASIPFWSGIAIVMYNISPAMLLAQFLFFLFMTGIFAAIAACVMRL